MKNNICFPEKFLRAANLNNKEINILLCLYRNSDNKNVCRMSMQEIGEKIGDKHSQSISRSIARLKREVGLNITKERTAKGVRNVYQLEQPKSDFTALSFSLYDKYCTKAEVIASYIKLKRVDFVLRSKNKKGEFLDYVSLGGWSFEELSNILGLLRNEGLINNTLELEFLLENPTSTVKSSEMVVPSVSCHCDCVQEGSASYLTSLYYELSGSRKIESALSKQIAKVENVIKAYSYEEAEIIVRELAKQKDGKLNYIEHRADDILRNSSKSNVSFNNPTKKVDKQKEIGQLEEMLSKEISENMKRNIEQRLGELKGDDLR